MSRVGVEFCSTRSSHSTLSGHGRTSVFRESAFSFVRNFCSTSILFLRACFLMSVHLPPLSVAFAPFMPHSVKCGHGKAVAILPTLGANLTQKAFARNVGGSGPYARQENGVPRWWQQISMPFLHPEQVQILPPGPPALLAPLASARRRASRRRVASF